MEYKYKPGDLVCVRNWDDLVQEFGRSGSGIGGNTFFVEEMKRFCGTQFVIRKVHHLRLENAKAYYLDELDSNDGPGWFFDERTLEPVSIKQIEKEELLELMI